MIVTASTSETSTAIVSVIESAAKNWPTTPSSSRSGRNTTTVVIVDVVTGHDQLLHRLADGAVAIGREAEVPHDVLA